MAITAVLYTGSSENRDATLAPVMTHKLYCFVNRWWAIKAGDLVMHKRRHWAGHNLTLITTGTKLINVLLEFNVGAMIERARSTLRSCVR